MNEDEIDFAMDRILIEGQALLLGLQSYVNASTSEDKTGTHNFI